MQYRCETCNRPHTADEVAALREMEISIRSALSLARKNRIHPSGLAAALAGAEGRAWTSLEIPRYLVEPIVRAIQSAESARRNNANA